MPKGKSEKVPATARVPRSMPCPGSNGIPCGKPLTFIKRDRSQANVPVDCIWCQHHDNIRVEALTLEEYQEHLRVEAERDQTRLARMKERKVIRPFSF